MRRDCQESLIAPRVSGIQANPLVITAQRPHVFSALGFISFSNFDETAWEVCMYIYERREWSFYGIFSILCGCVLVGVIILFDQGQDFFVRYAFRLFLLLFAIAFLSIASRANIWIALTGEELKIRVGYVLARRTIRCDDILGAERVRIRWTQAQVSRGWFSGVERFAVSPGPGFRIDVKNGKPCIVQSRYTEEILAALKRTAPAAAIE